MRFTVLTVSLYVFLIWGLSSSQAASDLSEQLMSLGEEAQFEIVGISKLEGARTVKLRGSEVDSTAKLQRLLQGYSYILLYDENGKIASLHITGANKAVEAPRRDIIELRRVGSHHMVSAVIAGPNGRETSIEMLLDTGASSLTLPASMIEPLGFRRDELRSQISNTANGSVPVLTGALALVKLGRVEAKDVAVNFIEDQRLGDQKLLGMSFLGRFRVTIDDRGNRLLLMKK